LFNKKTSGIHCDDTGFIALWDLNTARYLLAVAAWCLDEYDGYVRIPTPDKRVKTFTGTDMKFPVAEISGLFGGEVDIQPISSEGFCLQGVRQMHGKLVVSDGE
jgi:hypothetical protein